MYGQVERGWEIPVCFTVRQFREHCERTNVHCSAGSWKHVSRTAGNWDRIGGRSGGTEWSQRGKRLRSSRPRRFSLCIRSRVRPPKHLPYSDSKLKWRKAGSVRARLGREPVQTKTEIPFRERVKGMDGGAQDG